MTRRQWGTFHLVPNAWDGHAEDADLFVLEAHRYGPSHIEMAVELARLADDEERAKRIKEIADRAYSRDIRLLESRDIDDLLVAIDGLEAQVTASVLGPSDRIRPDKIADMRARSSLLDMDESRGEDAVYAVVDSFTQVADLRAVLRDAQERRLHIFID